MVIVTILLVNLTYNTAGVANCKAVCGNVFTHYGTRTNNYIVANGYASQNNYVATDPYIVANNNRFCLFPTLVAQFRMKRMPDRVKADIRYKGAKRFSLEGSDAFIPLMKEIIRHGGKNGVKEIRKIGRASCRERV